MGNLLSLNVSIHQRGTDTKKPCGCLHVNGHFEALDITLLRRLPNRWTFLAGVHDDSSDDESPMRGCDGSKGM
jgi:hypothetical protein